ncbi:MAG: tryptophan 2,3-dioxygenase [Planctomycetota bacterium]|jgi:tryptophan 2,3-dioxygenase
MSTHAHQARLTYSQYLKVPELLDLQECLAEPPAHDELQFIVVHQVYELWFKLVLHELDEVKAAIETGTDAGLRRATRLCRRVKAIFDILVPQIHVLESMRPVDFLAFRARLNPASGFQSAQFREVECIMGLKDETLVRRVENDPRIDRVHARMAAPSIPDVLYAVLARRGLSVTAPGPTRSDSQQAATRGALASIYANPDDEPALYPLFEILLDLDEQLILWRRHHVMMVERQIGDKPGTGKGTTGDLDGIRYLVTTLGKRALPDLWAVRTLLEG